MRGDNVIAINLGSVNTSIYQIGAGVVLLEPSVVAITNSGKQAIKAVGDDAKKLIGKTAESTSIIFPIFEGQIEDVNLASALIKTFLIKIKDKRLGSPQVLASVPCGTPVTAIKEYQKAFNRAGVYSVDFVESPMLTALGLQVPITQSTPCFIIDIGGGTTNISAVSLDGIIAGVSVNMGGSNIDAMLIDYLEEYFNIKIGVLTAEKIKIQIGSLLENDVTRMIASGRDIETGKPRSISLSAEDIKLPIKLFFDKIFEITAKVMAKLPAEVSAEIRREGVYFAGGTSQIIGLKEYFREQMAISANSSEQAILATVIGGGMVAGDKKLLKSIKIKTK